MESCLQKDCQITKQLKEMNFKITILTYMIGILLFIVAWAAYTVVSCYEFEYVTTSVTIDSSDGTGDVIYQDGEGNIINGKIDSEENKDQPQK